MWLTRLFGSKIDYTCSLHPSCKIEYPWNVTMGGLSSLGEQSWVYAMAPITIGEKSCIGKDVYLLTGSHDVNSPHFTLVTRNITIGSAVWLATGCKVLPGICISSLYTRMMVVKSSLFIFQFSLLNEFSWVPTDYSPWFNVLTD